jgi:hypothetical protein
MFRQRFWTSDDASRSVGLGNGALVNVLPPQVHLPDGDLLRRRTFSYLYSRYERSAVHMY